MRAFGSSAAYPTPSGIIPTFADGDALSEPLGFGDASQYASIDAGTYDLDFLQAESGLSLLTLPQTPFAEGTTTDVILVGQVSDGTLTALVQSVQVELARAVGQSAQIFTGSCGRLKSVAADLGIVQAGSGRGSRVHRGRIRWLRYSAPAGIPFADPHRVSARRRRFGRYRPWRRRGCLWRHRWEPDRHRRVGDCARTAEAVAPSPVLLSSPSARGSRGLRESLSS